MRAMFVRLVVGLLLAFPATVRSETNLSKPWMPPTPQVLAVGGIATGIVTQVPVSQAAALPLSHFSSSQPAYALNHLKGDFGEWLMDDVMAKRLLRVTGGWSIATPARAGRAGIDGIYFKTDSTGRLHDLLIADAKYGSARLGVLKDGTKQMSGAWIKPRLESTARMYRSYASDMGLRNTARADGAAKNAAANRVTLPLNDRLNVEVWRTPEGLRYFCADNVVAPADVQRQLNRAARYLEEAASGKRAYRPRVFSYAAAGREHVFTIGSLDSDANLIASRQVRGTFEQLPVEYQKTVRSQVRQTLIAAGKTRVQVRVLADEICRDANKFNRICMQPRHSYLAGIDARSIGVAGALGIMAMGLDSLAQVWRQDEFDGGRVVATGALATGSAVVGNYAGTQASSLLLARCSPLVSEYGGAILGGGVAASLFSYGLYASGYIDARTAHSGAVVGLGAAAITPFAWGMAYNGAMAFALSYGTAGTGAAVSSLSGAAATNAAAAWLGGGTLASGGGGAAAAGGSILVTGGTVIIVIAATVAIERTVHYVLYFKDTADQQRYLSTIVDYTRDRVLSGRQQEWRETFQMP